MTVETKVVLGLVAFLILHYGPAILYFKFGLFKGFYHDILGWHMPYYKCDQDDARDVCKYCGEEILQDSQGNWFVYREDGGAEG